MRSRRVESEWKPERMRRYKARAVVDARSLKMCVRVEVRVGVDAVVEGAAVCDGTHGLCGKERSHLGHPHTCTCKEEKSYQRRAHSQLSKAQGARGTTVHSATGTARSRFRQKAARSHRSLVDGLQQVESSGRCCETCTCILSLRRRRISVLARLLLQE